MESRRKTLCVGALAGFFFEAAILPVLSQPQMMCTPTGNLERCRQYSPGGLVTIMRDAASKRVRMREIVFYISPGSIVEQSKLLDVTMEEVELDSAAREIVRNAWRQCMDGSAEIGVRIKEATWQFAAPDSDICYLRIR